MKKIAYGALAISVMLVILAVVMICGWTALDTEKITRAQAASVILDREGKEAIRLSGSETRICLTEKEIPQQIKNAFVAAEDARFYTHSGIDIKRILGAAISNIKSGALREGGSTITQQLIKLTHLTGEKTFSRKLNEAYLAIRLEKRMTKDEILMHYLNTVYFGRGAYGIECAARAYFSKGADELTLSETALLAGIIKAPSAYSPDENMNKAIERRNYVLRKMLEEGFIGKKEYEAALAEPPSPTEKTTGSEYGWYRDYVICEAAKCLGITADELLTGGYVISTHLDVSRQKLAQELFEEKAFFPPDAADGTRVQAALIAADPRNGGIYCMVGGREYEVQRGLNRAADARRQPGSTVKPISVYAAAIDALGLSPSDIVDDTWRVFEGGYAPGNANDSYNGLVTLREALSRSLNVASVSLIEFTGVERAKEYLVRAGIPVCEQDLGLSLALGSMTYGVTPLELAAAYAPLANGGMRVTGHAVTEIRDRNGRTVYKAPSGSAARVMARESAYLITDMLTTAVSTGSARGLKRLGIPIAAKTGTVAVDENTNRDLWTAAYTPDMVAVCWMGFDETTREHAMSASETGSTRPLLLLAEFFENESAVKFPVPEGIVRVRLDKDLLYSENRAMLAPNGVPSSLTVEEVYRAADRPKRISPAFSVPEAAADARVFERNGDVIAEIEIENDHYEYLLIRSMNGEKSVLARVTGKKGEKKEIVIEPEKEDSILTVVIRNRLMHQYGNPLTSAESEGVWIYGKTDLISQIEKLFLRE